MAEYIKHTDRALYLIDRNAKPTKTIYYISSVVYQNILENNGITIDALSDKVSSQLSLNYRKQQFLLLALDFLFIVGKIRCDENGLIHANKISKTS